MATGMSDLVDCTPLLERKDELERFWLEHGYLLLRGVLDPELLATLRDQAAEGFRSHGMDMDDVASIDVTPGFDLRPLHEAVDYDRLWQHPTTIGLLERVMGEPVFVHAATSIRFQTPTEHWYLAPPHQDGAYLGPNKDFRTIWVPLLPVTSDVGGLAIADGSYRNGQRQHVPSAYQSLTYSKVAHGVPEETIEEPWAYAEMAVGDCIIFHAFTCHRSVPNTSSKGRLRLSLDTRFQPATSPRGFAAITPLLKQLERPEEGVFSEMDRMEAQAGT